MKKKYIYVLIGIITTALIGLVAIQIYWIDNAVKLKEEDFNRNVRSALFTVANKLEKIDAVNRIKAHQKGQQLFNQKINKLNSTLQNNNFDTTSLIKKDGITYKVSEKQSKDGTLYQQSIQSVSPNGLIGFQFSIHGNGQNTTVTDSNNPDSFVLPQNNQSSVLNEMLENLFETNQYRAIKERIDKNLLDSLLKSEFINKKSYENLTG